MSRALPIALAVLLAVVAATLAFARPVVAGEVEEAQQIDLTVGIRYVNPNRIGVGVQADQQQVDRGQGHRAGQWIGHEGRPVHQDALAVGTDPGGDPFGSQGRRERHITTGQGLAETQDVR